MKLNSLRAVTLCAALALPLVGCESKSHQEVSTEGGQTHVERKTEVGLDPDVKAKANEVGQDMKDAGHEVKEAGKEAVQDVKDGAKGIEKKRRKKNLGKMKKVRSKTTK